MNVDKAKKRIAKQLKKGINGYPKIELEYFGKASQCATEVVISFILNEGDEPQEQRFKSETDAKEDEAVQSILVKIIERANAATVAEIEGITLLK